MLLLVHLYASKPHFKLLKVAQTLLQPPPSTLEVTQPPPFTTTVPDTSDKPSPPLFFSLESAMADFVLTDVVDTSDTIERAVDPTPSATAATLEPRWCWSSNEGMQPYAAEVSAQIENHYQRVRKFDC